MRIAGLLLCTLLLVALAAGCGDSSSSDQPRPRIKVSSGPATASNGPAGARAQACDSYAVDAARLRSTGVACDVVRQVVFAWQHSPACATAGASRSSCMTGGYRCLDATTDRGVAVSCAAKGRSISFTAKRG